MVETMTEPAEAAEANGESASDTGVGALLRASRMRVGEDLRDVALMLRIRYPYLQAIEDGRFNDLPGQTYAVGFVRAYADHLGLDSEEVVRRYKDEQSGGNDPRADLRFPTPMTEAGVPGGAIVFIGIVIAVLAYGGWYLSTTKDNFFIDLIEPLPERLAALVSGDEAETGAPPAEAAKPAAPAEAPSQPAEPEPATKPAEAPAAETASPAAAPEPAAAETPAAEAQETAAPSAPETPPATAETATETATETAAPAAAEAAPAETPGTPAAEASSPPAAEPAAAAEAPSETSAEAPAETAQSEPAAAETTETAEPAAPAPAETSEPAAAASQESSPAAETPAATETSETTETAAAPATGEATAETDTQEETAPETPDEPAVRPSRVMVRAKDNSWIQVRDDFANELLVTRLLKAGEEYHVPNQPGLRLLTGNAGALEILVDGAPVPAIGEEGVVRRGVLLDPQMLQAGTAVSE